MVDHYLIFAVRKVNAKRLIDKQAQIVQSHSLRSYDKQLFFYELLSNEWDKTFASTNMNRVISALQEVYAPQKRVKIPSHHVPWITIDLKNLMKKRHLAKKTSEKDGFLLVRVQETKKQSYL